MSEQIPPNNQLRKARGFTPGLRRTQQDDPDRAVFVDALLAKRRLVAQQPHAAEAQDCLRSRRVAASCDACHTRCEPTHMPLRVLHGFYCGGCCPVCSPAGAVPKKAAEEVRVD